MWMDSKGMAPQFMREYDWEKFDFQVLTQDEINHFYQPVAEFFEQHTKDELIEGGRKRDVYIFPVFTIKETFEFPQLEAREFWQSIEHPELGVVIPHPGAFVKFSETPLRTLHRSSPGIGEHNIDNCTFTFQAQVYRGSRGL